MTELNYLDITKANDGHIRVSSIGLTSPAITESIAKTALASFADGAEGIPVSSLIADINPVQTGSGDPSPSNVRPITGWTGMNVYRMGKNLLNTEAMVAGILNTSGVVDVQGVTIGAKTKASITWTSSSTWRGVTSDFIPVTAGGHYYLSLIETVSYVIYAWYDANKTFISRASYNGSSMQSVTAPNNAAFVRYTLQQSTAGTFTYHNIQLESGSTATTYEPYNGTTYPISWADEAGTVYGGTLDVTNGLLTVTHQIVDLASMTFGGGWQLTSDWVQLATTGLTNVGAMTYLNAIGSMRLCTSSGNAWRFWRLANNQSGLTFAKADLIANGYDGSTAASAISAASAYEAGLATHDTIMYPLATPITYQLTPQAVLTILGQNNIWADTGDVEVSYVADTKLYIDKVLTE